MHQEMVEVDESDESNNVGNSQFVSPMYITASMYIHVNYFDLFANI